MRGGKEDGIVRLGKEDGEGGRRMEVCSLRGQVFVRPQCLDWGLPAGRLCSCPIDNGRPLRED